MSKPKVLHIVGGMNIGGTETMLMNVYRKIYNEIQFDFISYYNEDGYYDEEIRGLGGKVIKLKLPSKRGYLKSVRELKDVIKNEGGYIAVHTHTLFNCGIGVLAARVARVKIRISHAHTTSYKVESLLKKVYMFIMQSLIKRFSTNFISCSDAAGEYLFGYKLLSDDRYLKLPNYIDYEKFINDNVDKAGLRNQLGINEDDIIVGHIGRFVEAKNHEFLLSIIKDMISKNPRVKGILVGDGELRDNIEKKIRNLGIEDNMWLLGERQDIEKLLKIMDVFILPSTYEGLGLVLLEAQASGVPCIASYAIQPEADLNLGLLVKLNLEASIEVWSYTALSMLSEPEIDKMLIERAFECKEYRIEDIKSKLYEVYGIELEGDIDEKCINSIL